MKETILCEEIQLWRDERGIYQVVGKSRERGTFVLMLSDGQLQEIPETVPHLKFSAGPFQV